MRSFCWTADPINGHGRVSGRGHLSPPTRACRVLGLVTLLYLHHRSWHTIDIYDTDLAQTGYLCSRNINLQKRTYNQAGHDTDKNLGRMSPRAAALKEGCSPRLPQFLALPATLYAFCKNGQFSASVPLATQEASGLR